MIKDNENSLFEHFARLLVINSGRLECQVGLTDKMFYIIPTAAPIYKWALKPVPCSIPISSINKIVITKEKGGYAGTYFDVYLNSTIESSLLEIIRKEHVLEFINADSTEFTKFFSYLKEQSIVIIR